MSLQTGADDVRSIMEVRLPRRFAPRNDKCKEAGHRDLWVLCLSIRLDSLFEIFAEGVNPGTYEDLHYQSRFSVGRNEGAFPSLRHALFHLGACARKAGFGDLPVLDLQ